MEEVSYLLLSFVPALAKASGFIAVWRPVRTHLRTAGSAAAVFALSLWLWTSASPRQWVNVSVFEVFAQGALCALPFALLIESLPVTGQLLDLFRGAQAAEQLMGAERVSAGEGLCELALLYFLFSAGAYQRPLEALFSSAVASPLSPDQAAALLGGVFLCVCPAASLSVAADLIFGGAARMSRVSAASELANMKLYALQFALFLYIFCPPASLLKLLGSF